MSYARIAPDSAYVDGVTTTLVAGWWQAIDTRQAAGLDGDAGNGTWAPSSSIEIGGAGMWCCGLWTLSPPSTGTVQVQITSSAPLVHGDNDYIELASGHSMASRTLVTQMALGKDSSGCPTLQTYSTGSGQSAAVMGPTAAMIPSWQYNAMSNTPGASYPYRPGGRIVCPMRVHNGATLYSVTFYFVIATHSSITSLVFPQFRVHKVDILGNLTPLYTGGAPDGFVELAGIGSVSAYNAATQAVYFCDAGTVIDTSKYSYFVEVIDESNAAGGTAALPGNIFTSAAADFTSIADMRPQ